MKVVLTVIAAIALARAALGQQPTSSVLTVVRAEFAGWDRDRDGKLTVAEVDLAVLDPTVRGARAAALAVIKAIERRNSDGERATPPLTLADLAQYEAERNAGESDDDDYEEWFDHYRRKLDATSRELFPQSEPRVLRIKQGDLGDCFCLAVIASAVHRDPTAFARGISRNADGTYTVRFGGHADVVITAPTDTEIAINSSARENGLWLTVYEKACGTVANRFTPPGKRTVEPTDSIAYGGLASDVIALVTGHACQSVERTDGELAQALAAGTRGRHLMYTTLRRDIDEPAGLISGHVYAVLAYDSVARRVTVFDPRGHDHRPTGDVGVEHGFPTRDGVLEVSLDDFVRVFDGVGIEDRDTPAAK